MKNCIDSPCKHLTYSMEPFGEAFCVVRDILVPDDIDVTGCKNFELAETCLDCKHARTTIYETGTIDDIEYRCVVQNNKLVYDDGNCGIKHYADVPKCPIGKFVLCG